MNEFKGANVALIGVGGMGARYIRAYHRLGARVVALCDKNEAALDRGRQEAPQAERFLSASKFISAMADRVDLVSVVTDTPSRVKLLLDLLQAGVRRVTTEKPFTTNVADAYEVTEAYEKAGTQLTVNTFRHFCPNHLRLRELIRSGRLGKVRHVSIQSASAGLGNMGSVFFDVMNFYIESRPIEVIGKIDRIGTPNVRGAQFSDPGGYGVVNYADGARGFIDTSEDTGVPYTFHIVTTYGRIFIEELLNRWKISVRMDHDKVARPLTYYLAPTEDIPFELTHGYDPVEMTSFAIEAALSDLAEASNARQAVTVMEMIMAMHVSDAAGQTPVRLPLNRQHHALDVPFA